MKKAYFEEHFRRRALLSQSSSDFQNGADSQASFDGPENTDYEGDFEHVNEIGHSACFVENHDRPTTLLENGKYQACENKAYVGHLELVNEVGRSAYFDENHDRSTHLSKNGKYQAKNTGYDGDLERVNEVGDSARFEESFDGSNNGDIEVTECGREGSSNGDIEATEHMEAEAKFNLNAGNADFNDPKPTIEVKEKQEGQDSSIEFSSNSVYLSSYAHTTEKDGSVSSEPRQSSSSKFFMKLEEKVHAKEEETHQLQARTQDFASKTKSSKSQSRPSTAGAKATSAIENIVHFSREEVYNRCFTNEHLNVADSPQEKKEAEIKGEISISKQLSCLPSTVNLTTAQKKPRYACYAAYFLRALCYFNLIGLGDKVYTDNRFLRVQKLMYLINIKEEKVHAKKEETCQLQARKQEKKEAEIKQLRRNLNFKATPMPTFYREPGRRSEKNKDGQSWEEAGARAAVRDRWRMDRKENSRCSEAKTVIFCVETRPSTAAGARATNATENTVRCLRAEVYNRCSTNEGLNMADSP
ncbi:hypothetical protein BC332_34185 [Capsicum chinense]|nr:hypothetical protein BC332_34185 [Capsicum chinense]